MKRRALLRALALAPALPSLARAFRVPPRPAYDGAIARIAPIQARVNAAYDAWLRELERTIMKQAGLSNAMLGRTVEHFSFPEQSGYAQSILVNTARARAGR